MSEEQTTEPLEPEGPELLGRQWIEETLAVGPGVSGDLMAAVLPLLEQVAVCHERGEVAPLDGLDALGYRLGRLWFPWDRVQPGVQGRAAVEALERPQLGAIEVVGDYREHAEEDAPERESLAVREGDDAVVRPVFCAGWTTWEQEAGHHDALTDVLACGQVLGALATGLDLGTEQGLRAFAKARGNLFLLNPKLHPVIAKLIVAMTDVRRHKRVQDMASCADTLRNYRQTGDLQSLERGELFAQPEVRGERDRILGTLRDRLFEISRRNRLLYFKRTLGMVDLTEASVPVLLDYKHIDPAALCTWSNVGRILSEGKTLECSDYLRFEDAPYLPGLLDKLRSEDRRNRAEFGFSQLRLCLVFLRWHDLKGEKQERIHSPLLLLPVKIDKQKGVRDRYDVVPASEIAEVNPVLRHHLSRLYGLELPTTVDLSKTSMAELHEHLEAQILASEPGVSLRSIERPEIELVHQRARKRLEHYRKRARLGGRGVKHSSGVDYSYRRENFQPLGLQLYSKHVNPGEWPLAGLSGADPGPRMPTIGAGEDEKPRFERLAYALKRGSEENPYVWDFDQCALTLGNFNYRRMTLVRDYDQLQEEEGLENRTFTELFTSLDRSRRPEEVEATPHAARLHVLPADPTQAAAVTRARSGESFIIQGPPGTGKSQTITNLIADAVGGGKRVLFVCAKRAALDVVYQRLEACGLGSLCCLIHDSQGDKKSFVHELRDTYEALLAEEDALSSARGKRTRASNAIARGQEQLEQLGQRMLGDKLAGDLSLREAVGELVGFEGELPEFDARAAEGFPSYALFSGRQEELESLEERLADLGREGCFGLHGLRHLHAALLSEERPLAAADAGLAQTRAALVELAAALDAAGVQPSDETLFAELGALLAYAQELQSLAEHGALGLLDEGSQDSADLEQASAELLELERAVESAQEVAQAWREPFEPRDLADVRDLAERVEGKWYRFVLPGWYKLKQLMGRRYDLSVHSVQPAFSRLLQELADLQAAQAAVEEQGLRTQARFFPVGEHESVQGRVEALREGAAQLGPLARALHERVAGDPDGAAAVESLLQAREVHERLCASLAQLLRADDGRVWSDLTGTLDELEEGLRDLPGCLEELQELAAGDGHILDFAARHPWNSAQIQAVLLRHAVSQLLASDRELREFGQEQLEDLVQGLNTQRERLLERNAKLVVLESVDVFRTKLARSSLPASQLKPDEKGWKKIYTQGRKALEREFAKVMRYKAIRDLATDESGLVLRDIKPVWLMSPLSVSDTLPLDPELFDLVIFDEASQVPLEEAVPSIFRGKQCIVVGDTMQLPPTDFFSSKRSGSSEEDADAEVFAAEVGFDLDAASFLAHSDLTLPSVMLGWHYRSRSEALIDFSNAAFYQRSLLTIPDCSLDVERAEIRCEDPRGEQDGYEGGDAARATLERPISFHYLPKAVYHKRRNQDEAEYVARLVRGLLVEAPERSIGVVAFSEAQQGELELALERLAEEDEEFGELYERAMDKEDDDEAEPLFIKNLENVQGDERDVIVLSVCYGPDDAGKMRMNFGPINKGGGEKRLNVVFSRARRHMAVVSSFTSERITNDYNDGANCLKRYLRYAQASSRGDARGAARVLDECHPAPMEAGQAAQPEAVLDSLSDWLREQGWVVDRAVGRSRFQVDIGVRAAGEARYRLALSVDTAAHYANPDVIEAYCQRPGVLAAFGWTVLRVLAIDWLDDRGAVEARLRELLGPVCDPH
ncbi:MAG: hypothetical protein ACI8QC_000396 [Planctomycetota bacterium]